MAEPTNLDLWQLVSGGGSADLNLGGSADYEVINGSLYTVGVLSSITLPARLGFDASFVPENPEGLGTLHAVATIDASMEIVNPVTEVKISAIAALIAAINCTSYSSMKPLPVDYLLPIDMAEAVTGPSGIQFISAVDLNVFRGPSSAPSQEWAPAVNVGVPGTLALDVISSKWQHSAHHFEVAKHRHEEAALATSTIVHPHGALPKAYSLNRFLSVGAAQFNHRQFLYNNELADGDTLYRYQHGELASTDRSKGWPFYAKTPRLHHEHRDKFEHMVQLLEATIGDVLGAGAQLWYENKSWYEEAGYPAHGRTPPSVKPVKPVIPWNPSTNLNLHVLDDGTNNLEFYHGDFYEDCLTVTPQKVYVVMNEVRLFIVGTNEELPLLNMSLSIDRDAWAWGYKVNIPHYSLPLLKPVVGRALELDLHINGTVFRVIAEKVSASRTFERKTLEVSGRGISAYLSKPYAAARTFSSAVDMTAQQLMNNALTWNGQPIGWEVDWGITDWLVPAGVWSVQGTYIDAVKSIADAVGAMILPHPSEKKLLIRPKYPSTPWNWDSATPNYQIPDHVVQQEGIEWVENPSYNAIYVTGQSQGVLGYVKRQGTAGNLQAPMVVDSLITDVAAARMRGEAELATAGLLAEVTTSLPVLPETGIIMPGKMFQYVENGESKMGVTTGVSLTQRNGSPVLRQEVGVTLHG